MLEETMSSTSDRHTYRLTDSGHKQAARALAVLCYVAPAPVSLEAYAAMLRWGRKPPLVGHCCHYGIL
jgi:hypothetical protein